MGNATSGRPRLEEVDRIVLTSSRASLRSFPFRLNMSRCMPETTDGVPQRRSS